MGAFTILINCKNMELPLGNATEICYYKQKENIGNRLEVWRKEMKPITHALVFPLVMENPHICSRLLKMILPEGDYPDIDELTEENITVEKNFIRVKYKDSRFDVYIQTDMRKIEMEMQNDNKKKYHTPKRSKYYHIQMGKKQLDKRDSYEMLMPTTVIFLCMFDYFGLDHPIYTFKMDCQEYPGLNLDEGTCTIILNLKYSGDELTDEMNELFSYFRNGIADGGNDFVSEIHHEVQRVNIDEEGAIMTWEEEMKLEAEVLAEKMAKELAEPMAKELAKSMVEEKYNEKLRKSIEVLYKAGISVDDISKSLDMDISEVEEYLE